MLKLDQLTCVRGERRLFDGLSLTLRAGDVLLLKGPNGSGKTSLLRMVAGYLNPKAGTVQLAGAKDLPRAVQMHFHGHQDGIKPTLSVREMLSFWRGLLGGAGDIQSSAAAWGIADLLDLPCGVLSAGQKRRVALVRLDLTPRKVWLLDEPTAPLDQSGQSLVERAIKRHTDEGGIALVATHRALDIAGAQTLSLGAEA